MSNTLTRKDSRRISRSRKNTIHKNKEENKNQELEGLKNFIQKLQKEKEQSKIRVSISDFENKKNENTIVKNELNLLDDEDVVYKLIGPILVQQETSDAKIHYYVYRYLPYYNFLYF